MKMLIAIHLFLLITLIYGQNEIIYGKTRLSALGTYKGIFYNLTNEIEYMYGEKREINLGSIVPIEAYLGIRYGMITNRFMPPRLEKRLISASNVFKKLKYRMHTGVESVIALDRLSQVCPQPNTNFTSSYERHILHRQSEDCLYLNIYRPDDTYDMNLKPVMVLVHGDSFMWGSGNLYNMSLFASMARVIVVTLNYRLGPLGFLSFGDYRGNVALWDIQTALTWLKTFISDFGGDPSEITLFGRGHGASLVTLLMSSPDNHIKTLFKRAILHSGSYMSSWSLITNSIAYSNQFINELNCNHTDLTRIYECLQEASIEQINRATLEIRTPLSQEAFGPVEGDKLVELNKRKSEFEIRLAGNITHDVLFGFETAPNSQNSLSFIRDPHEYLTDFVRSNFDFHHKFIEDTLVFHYGSTDKLTSLKSILNDHQIVIPLINFIENWQKRQRLQARKYCFVFNNNNNNDNNINEHSLNEFDYLLGKPILHQNHNDTFTHKKYTDVDRVLSEVMIQYWSNFIKYGSPNEPHILSNPQTLFKKTRGYTYSEWKEYSLENKEYLSISTTRLKLETNLKLKEKYLYNNLLFELNKEKIENDSLRSMLVSKHDKLAFYTIDFITNKMTTSSTPIVSLVINDTYSSVQATTKTYSLAMWSSNLFSNQNIIISVLFISLIVVFINMIIMIVVCHQRKKLKNFKAHDVCQTQQLIIDKQRTTNSSSHGGSQDSSINTPVQSIPDSLLTTSTTNGASGSSGIGSGRGDSSPMVSKYHSQQEAAYNYLTMNTQQKWIQSPSRRMQLDSSTYKSFAFNEHAMPVKKQFYASTSIPNTCNYSHVNSRILDTVKKLDSDFNNRMKLFNDSAEDVV